jgi:simple sugar transport system substrate-binding protein
MWTVLVTFAALGALVATSCGSSTTTSTKSNIHIIAVMEGPVTDTHWSQIGKGLQLAGQQLGVTTTYLGVPASGSVDPAAFKRLLVTAMAQHPQGILIDDDVPATYDATIQQMVASGIAVIFLEYSASSLVTDGALSIVWTDDIQEAKAAGQRLSAAGCKVALVVTILKGEAQFADNRTSGFSQGFGGTVIRTSIPLSSINDPTAIKGIVSDDLIKNPTIGCTFASGELFTPAMVAAQQALGSRSTALTSGAIDVSPQILTEIQKKQLTFAIDPQPFSEGYLGTVALVNYLRYGQTPTANIGTGPAFVDATNVAKVIQLTAQGYR